MNKARRRALILFFALFAFGAIPIRTSAAGPGRAECRSIPSAILGHSVAYCVILPSNYDTDKAVSYPVLYFLHGLGGNEQLLLNSGGMDLIQDLRDQKKIGEFLVVTPNGGRTFYINSRDGKVRYEDFLVREFIPYIESHYRIRAGRKTRGITGVSMGGYGSLHLALRHPNLFGAVSAHSPALIEKLPKMQGSSQQATTVAMILGGAFGSPIDPAFWERESPFTIVSSGPRPTGLQIYFDCGTDDEYGFNRGAQQFHDLLETRGIPNEFHLYPGGHDWSYFADHLPASLAFHSRVFGLTPAAK